jgi:hypothetical protein
MSSYLTKRMRWNRTYIKRIANYFRCSRILTQKINLFSKWSANWLNFWWSSKSMMLLLTKKIETSRNKRINLSFTLIKLCNLMLKIKIWLSIKKRRLKWWRNNSENTRGNRKDKTKPWKEKSIFSLWNFKKSSRKTLKNKETLN